MMRCAPESERAASMRVGDKTAAGKNIERPFVACYTFIFFLSDVMWVHYVFIARVRPRCTPMRAFCTGPKGAGNAK